MLNLPIVETLPVEQDAHGVIRMHGSRVTLVTILNSYLQGDSPETIHDNFEQVPLDDIYDVIAYYLNHRDEVVSYLAKQDKLKEQSQLEIELQHSEQKQLRTRMETQRGTTN